MRNAAREGDPTAHTGTLGRGIAQVIVEGQPIAVVGTMHTCPVYDHMPGPVSEGSVTVLVKGVPAARVADRCICVSKNLAETDTFTPPLGFTPEEVLAMQCIAPVEPLILTMNDPKPAPVEASLADGKVGSDGTAEGRLGLRVEGSSPGGGIAGELDVAVAEGSVGPDGLDVSAHLQRQELTLGVGDDPYGFGANVTGSYTIAGVEGAIGPPTGFYNTDRYIGLGFNLGDIEASAVSAEGAATLRAPYFGEGNTVQATFQRSVSSGGKATDSAAKFGWKFFKKNLLKGGAELYHDKLLGRTYGVLKTPAGKFTFDVGDAILPPELKAKIEREKRRRDRRYARQQAKLSAWRVRSGNVIPGIDPISVPDPISRGAGTVFIGG